MHGRRSERFERATVLKQLRFCTFVTKIMNSSKRSCESSHQVIKSTGELALRPYLERKTSYFESEVRRQ